MVKCKQRVQDSRAPARARNSAHQLPTPPRPTTSTLVAASLSTPSAPIRSSVRSSHGGQKDDDCGDGDGADDDGADDDEPVAADDGTKCDLGDRDRRDGEEGGTVRCRVRVVASLKVVCLMRWVELLLPVVLLAAVHDGEHEAALLMLKGTRGLLTCCADSLLLGTRTAPLMVTPFRCRPTQYARCKQQLAAG